MNPDRDSLLLRPIRGTMAAPNRGGTALTARPRSTGENDSVNDSQNNPQITLRLSADQIEELMQALDFAGSSDPKERPDIDLDGLRDMLEAHLGEHLVFPDEEVEGPS